MPLNSKKARSSLVTATAGQRDGPRRMSGRCVARAPPNVRRHGAPSNTRAVCHSKKKSPPYSAAASAGRREAPRQMSGPQDAAAGEPGPTPFGRPYFVAASAGQSGRIRRLSGRREVARGRYRASSPQRRKRPPLLSPLRPADGRGLSAPCEVRPYFVTASVGQREGLRRMSGRRGLEAGFGVLPSDGSSRVLCRRFSRPIRDYLPTVRRTEVVGERAGPRRHPPGRKLARASSPLQQTGARVLAEPHGPSPVAQPHAPWLSKPEPHAPWPEGRVSTPRRRPSRPTREDQPAVRGVGGRDWGRWGEPGLNPGKARPFRVAVAAGRRKGPVKCPRDGIWLRANKAQYPLTQRELVHPSSPQPQASARSPAGSPGSRSYSDGWLNRTLSRREPRPYLCAAAAGRSERPRRMSGR